MEPFTKKEIDQLVIFETNKKLRTQRCSVNTPIEVSDHGLHDARNC
jgi:hypothetical protein